MSFFLFTDGGAWLPQQTNCPRLGSQSTAHDHWDGIRGHQSVSFLFLLSSVLFQARASDDVGIESARTRDKSSNFRDEQNKVVTTLESRTINFRPDYLKFVYKTSLISADRKNVKNFHSYNFQKIFINLLFLPVE